jgi:SAM-dependent methyltransferase
MSLEITEERFIPGKGGVTECEHLHRYVLACALASGLDVADIASGEGYGSYRLANVARSVVGIDISFDAIAHSTERYQRSNLRFIQGDCGNLPVQSSSLDLVVSFETIEHHDRHIDFLNEIKRVLRPSGLLIMSSPNRPEFNKTLASTNSYHIKELDFDEFNSLLNKHFSSVLIYGQRVTAGSLVVPYAHEEKGFIDFSHGEDIISSTLNNPIYFISLASNGVLPALKSSIFEISPFAISGQDTLVSRFNIYYSEINDGKPAPYDDSRKAIKPFLLDGSWQQLKIRLPDHLKCLTRMRFDISDVPGVFYIHKIVFHDKFGNVAFIWEEGLGKLLNARGVSTLAVPGSLIVLAYNSDPNFELSITPEDINHLNGGGCIVVDFTPYTLLAGLPKYIALTEQLQMNLSSHSVSCIPGLADLNGNLKWVFESIKNNITKKFSTIARQERQISAMRNELIRAEAQLSLLKEVFFSNSNIHDT